MTTNNNICLEIDIDIMGQDTTIAVQLVEVCYNCMDNESDMIHYPSGYSRVKDRKSECQTCEGQGYLITENGRKILEFIRRFGKD